MEDQHNLNNAIEGELQQAAQYIRSQHLRDLVHTPDRAALCLQFEDLTVDCTRQPITLKILEKLVMLAKAKSLPDLMDDLFAGKAINLSAGMTTTVEVKTEKRRIIEYFLSPLLRYKQESIRER